MNKQPSLNTRPSKRRWARITAAIAATSTILLNLLRAWDSPTFRALVHRVLSWLT